MARETDLSAIQRRRNLALERQAKAREEDAALEQRLNETAALGEARGAEYERKPQKRGNPRQPMRRLTGIAWLHGKGRITDDQAAAALRYGAAYRRAKGSDSIRSILDREVLAGSDRTIADLIEHADSVANAARKLCLYRRMLSNYPALVSACDLICGEEKTPREAASNGRGAEALEAVLLVALDLLNQHVAPSREGEPPDVADAA